jgi:serine/threonine protein kinase
MALTAGSRFGTYDIQSALGAGGMGEVYRARDVRLGRDVAIKILPNAFSLDTDRLARFEREARVLASLNHPNIGAIYGIEEDQGARALVLELVEGETLAMRMLRGLTMREALDIARQIAEALDAAHERGIVHRDLKPSNVMVTPAGVVKVLDFGLAKAPEATPSAELANSPTVTYGATAQGVLLGTAQYMSPEQARGHVVDKRCDLWAFGCVLFEMLTLRRAFEGATLTDTIAAIIEREPDLNLLPPSTPDGIRQLLRRCLAKNPARRMRDAGDVALDIETALADLAQPATEARTRERWPLWAIAGGGLAIVAGLLIASGRLRAPVSVPEPDRLPSLTRLTSDEGFTADPAISRDGALVAYASDRAGDNQLDIWIQQTAGSTPVRVTHDSFDEREPAFSPDGSQIAFRSERNGGGIYIVPAFGAGAPRFLAAGGRRPRFSPDGQSIAYWTGGNIGLSSRAGSYHTYVIPVAGGTPKEIAPQMTAARFPVWSPDGKALLLLGSHAPLPTTDSYAWWAVPLDGSAPIDTGTRASILAASLEAAETAGLNTQSGIAPDDWTGSRVLFSNSRYLWSIAIDPLSYRVAGSPQRLTFGTNHDAQPAISSSGVIVFSSASFLNTVFGLQLDSRTGTAAGTPARLTDGISNDARPSFSTDGRLLAYRSSTSKTTAVVRDIVDNRVIDLGVRPSTFGPGISPDGKWVAFESGNNIDMVPSQGGPSRTLCRDCQIGDWTDDSAGLAVITRDHLARVEVGSTSKRDLVRGAGINRPFVSPDQKLIAFRAVEDDLDRVYIARLDPLAAVSKEHWIPLSAPEADARPAGWSPDGRLLYIVSSRDGARCLYAIKIDRDSGRPQDDAFVVRHFHGSRNGWAATTGVLSTGPASAIRGGRFVYDIGTF